MYVYNTAREGDIREVKGIFFMCVCGVKVMSEVCTMILCYMIMRYYIVT